MLINIESAKKLYKDKTIKIQFSVGDIILKIERILIFIFSVCHVMNIIIHYVLKFFNLLTFHLDYEFSELV